MKHVYLKKTTRLNKVMSFLYPEPGSNRHGLLHWCLRPARLPIPPSGPLQCKVNKFRAIFQIKTLIRSRYCCIGRSWRLFVADFCLAEYLPVTVLEDGGSCAFGHDTGHSGSVLKVFS